MMRVQKRGTTDGRTSLLALLCGFSGTTVGRTLILALLHAFQARPKVRVAHAIHIIRAFSISQLSLPVQTKNGPTKGYSYPLPLF